MTTITATEFALHPTKYINLGIKSPFAIRKGRKIFEVSIKEKIHEDTLMSKEDFFAKIDKSRAQHERGEYTRCNTKDDLQKFFKEIEANV